MEARFYVDSTINGLKWGIGIGIGTAAAGLINNTSAITTTALSGLLVFAAAAGQDTKTRTIGRALLGAALGLSLAASGDVSRIAVVGAGIIGGVLGGVVGSNLDRYWDFTGQ